MQFGSAGSHLDGIMEEKGGVPNLLTMSSG